IVGGGVVCHRLNCLLTMRPFVSPFQGTSLSLSDSLSPRLSLTVAYCCTVVSFVGIIFLVRSKPASRRLTIQLVMAILFANNAEALMGSTEDPPDGGAVARTCIGAVIVYSVLLQIPHDPFHPLSFFVVIVGAGDGPMLIH